MIIEYIRIPELRRYKDKQALETALNALPGVLRIQWNLAEQRIRLERSADQPLAAILQAIHSAGYTTAVMV